MQWLYKITIWSIKILWFGLEAINIFTFLKWVFIHMLVFSRDLEQKLKGTLLWNIKIQVPFNFEIFYT